MNGTRRYLLATAARYDGGKPNDRTDLFGADASRGRAHYRERKRFLTGGADAGNTTKLNGQGVFIYQLEVQMYGSEKTIVINSMIGPNVIISQAA